MTLDLTEREERRLLALVQHELAAIKSYTRDTQEMHEGLHTLYRATGNDLRSIARKLTTKEKGK